MNHKELMEKYMEMFGFDYGDVELWFPNGKGSIRVRYNNKVELVFTYYGPNNWRLETVKEFLKNRKESVK